ncbi:retinol dehydrogenase 11-like [Argonauta hians]
MTQLIGRVAIVTGANCGLGFEVAKRLCYLGHDVILACRNEERGKLAVENLRNEQRDALATYMNVDLSDLSSIHKFVDDFHETGKPLDVLINNAGVFDTSGNGRKVTKDGFELTMGTNHLGHFLLTILLLEDLEKSADLNGESRIVNVASALHDTELKFQKHRAAPLDMNNFFLEKPNTYNGHQAYKNSKLANVMFTYELAERIRNKNITVNCCCPGFVPETNLGRDQNAFKRFLLNYVAYYFLRYMNIAKTLDEGTDAIMECAVGEKLKGITGKFFRNHQEAQSSLESLDKSLRTELWDASVLYCYLQDKVPPPCVGLTFSDDAPVKISVTPSPDEENANTEIKAPNQNSSKLEA